VESRKWKGKNKAKYKCINTKAKSEKISSSNNLLNNTNFLKLKRQNQRFILSVLSLSFETFTV